MNNTKIPIYGDGKNIRDWLYVEDHADALIEVINKGEIGEKYCIGGNEERSNNEIASIICSYLDAINPQKYSHKSLINHVEDRKGHDFRYSIETKKINKKLKWEPKMTFNQGIKLTIDWYFKNDYYLKNVIKNKYLK